MLSLQERNRLIEANVFLPDKVVSRLQHIASVRRLGREEACSYGRLALVQASRRFDPERGCSFRTWAYRVILNEVLRFSRKYGFCVKIPEHAWKLNRDPEKGVARMIAQSVQASEHADKLPDSSPDVPDIVSQWEMNVLVSQILSELRDSHRNVLWRYFFQHQNTREIARDLQISTQRVCQLKVAAQKKVAQKLESLGLMEAV